MPRCSFMFYDGHHQRAVRGDKSPLCYFMQCNAKHLIQLFSTQKFGKRKIINSVQLSKQITAINCALHGIRALISRERRTGWLVVSSDMLNLHEKQRQQALRNSCELLRQRKELQAHGTACKLLVLHASSWYFM